MTKEIRSTPDASRGSETLGGREASGVRASSAPLSQGRLRWDGRGSSRRENMRRKVRLIGSFVDQGFLGAGGSFLIAVKLPSSQQRTKPSVTHFNSSQRARMFLDSGLVIWLSVAAVAMTASRSANS